MAAHLVDGATGLVKKPAIFMLKLFSATAVKQDEAILRRADRIETDRTEACSELRAHMMKSQVYCRQALAETKKVGLKLASGLVKLEEAVAESDIAKERFFELRKNQRAMEELEEHKLDWNRAIHDWMTEAHGVDPQIDTDNPDTLTLAQLLSDYMAKGEKAAPKHSTAVITYHPSAPISECLMVAYATEPAEDGVGFTTGQRLRHSVKKKTPVEEAVWAVLENGNPVFSNPYNHPEVAEGAVSVVPLIATSGHRFGVVVSGPPALPDEFLETFSQTAGQMFERIGKLEFVWRICQNVQTFIEKQCLAVNKLVYVRLEKEKGPTPAGSEWDWQPLEHTHPTNEKRFELPLKWKGDERIGLFVVECGTFTAMDEQLIILLHTIADMLLEAVSAIEEMELGHEPPLGTAAKVAEEYEVRREAIAETLANELSRCVKISLTFYNCFVESAAYCAKVDDADTLRLMQAVLTLAGHTCKDWKEVRKHLKSPRVLVEALANASSIKDAIKEETAVVPLAGGADKVEKGKKGKGAFKKKVGRKNATRWNVAEAYLKGVDLTALERKSPVPVAILIRWLRMSDKIYKIGVATATRTEEALNPLAQRVFDAIDTDRSGALSTDEIVCHFLKEHGVKPAHKFLRVIDYNADGVVTSEEWHRAWRNGDFDVEIDEARGGDGKDGNDGAGPGLRVLSRHFSTGRMSPTQNGAAQKLEPLEPIKKKGGSKKGDQVGPH